MKYLDEYRNEGLAQKVVSEIRRVVTKPWVLMEVCGGQTHTIVKYGIDHLIPPEVELVHGPGCPVCVTSLEMRQGACDRASTGCNLHVVWRYVARPGFRMRPFATWSCCPPILISDCLERSITERDGYSGWL